MKTLLRGILWVRCLTIGLIALDNTARSYAGGGVTAWGYYYDLNIPETYRPMFVPDGLTNVIAVAGGYSHSLALRSDGKVVAWGQNPSGATAVPATASNIVAISTFDNYSLALRSDGGVISWGGETAPALSNVTAISAGMLFGVALKSDGTLEKWGLGGPTIPPGGISNVVSISAGALHVLALRRDGSIVALGWSVPPGLIDVVQVAAGADHSLALRSDGTVVAWGGWNIHGQINVPVGLSNVVSIAAGWYHNLALRSDGTIVAWGSGTNVEPLLSVAKGQSIVPAGLTNVLSIAGGRSFSLVLTNDYGFPSDTHAKLVDPVRGLNSFTVSVPTRSGRVYRLEYQNSLSDGTWTPFPLAAGNGGLLTLTDPTATTSQRFYRVRQW